MVIKIFNRLAKENQMGKENLGTFGVIDGKPGILVGVDLKLGTGLFLIYGSSVKEKHSDLSKFKMLDQKEFVAMMELIIQENEKNGK